MVTPLKLGLSFGQSWPNPKTCASRGAMYHAVAVLPSRNACEAAHAARGERVLADHAPLLPLEGCDRPGHCSCRYQHYDDRRSQPRRQVDGAPPSTSTAVTDVERRRSSGRRAEDRLEFDDDADDEPETFADTYFGFHGKS